MSINLKRRLVLLNVMVASAITFTNRVLASESSTSSKTTQHQIIISGFSFEPAIVKIKAGDNVRWLNKDIVPHTATASDESWDTGIIEMNQSKSVTFSKSSTSSYFCFYHPTMKAKLEIVIEN